MQLINSPDNLFHDGNPATGALGTFLAAAWHNAVQAELAAPILAAGLALDPNNNAQLLAAILALIESKTGNYALDTGTTNAYVIALNPAVTAYTNGLPVAFRAVHGCTGPSTLNAGGGPKPLLRDDGQQLQQGDIPPNSIVSGTYDTSAAAFLINSIVASQFDAIMQSGSPMFAIDTGAANAYVGTFAPAITARNEGQVLRLKIKTTNNGASTFNDGLGPAPVVGLAHAALQGGEFVAGGDAWLQWNSTVGSNGSYILLHCTGAPSQIASATQSQHAVAMGQTQTQAGTAFATSGTAPAYTLTPSPAITVYAANQRFRVAFGATGTTGSNTLNINGLGAKSLMQYDANGTLVPAVIPAGLLSDVEYNGTYAVVLDPVAQSNGVVGLSRGIKASLTAAGTSITFTGVETIAKTATGGASYVNSNWSDTLNLTATGAGGMDTGSAPTSGYVAIYRIYNPTTAVWKLLGYNATSVVAGETYSGTNMPAGFTASALISVWPTNGSGQLIVAEQEDRKIAFAAASVLNTVTAQGTPYPFSISTTVPKNAKEAAGNMSVTCTAANNVATVTVFGSAGGADGHFLVGHCVYGGNSVTVPFSMTILSVSQTLYYAASNVVGSSAGFGISVSSYTF